MVSKTIEFLQLCLEMEKTESVPVGLDLSDPSLAHLCAAAVLDPDSLGFSQASGAAKRELATRTIKLLTAPVWRGPSQVRLLIVNCNDLGPPIELPACFWPCR